jgi:hypothetical protein
MTIAITTPATRMLREESPAGKIMPGSRPVAGRSGTSDAPHEVQNCSSGSTALPHWGQKGISGSPVWFLVLFAGAKKKVMLILGEEISPA